MEPGSKRQGLLHTEPELNLATTMQNTCLLFQRRLALAFHGVECRCHSWMLVFKSVPAYTNFLSLKHNYFLFPICLITYLFMHVFIYILLFTALLENCQSTAMLEKSGFEFYSCYFIVCDLEFVAYLSQLRFSHLKVVIILPA